MFLRSEEKLKICISVRHILELKDGLGTKGTVLQLDERKKENCLTITLHETLLYIQSNSATKKMEVEGVVYAHGTYQLHKKRRIGKKTRIQFTNV